jgi:ketosteroid isomerase-like protein
MAGALRQMALVIDLLVFAVGVSGAKAQPLTREMVETHVKEAIAAYDSNDVERIVKADPAAIGFGYRVLGARPSDASIWSNGLKAFIAGADYYRIQLDEMHTDVDGNIGLAWGFFTEDFKLKDRSPEKVRVRFTYTYKYDQGTWRTLLYHRDIQKFDERGRYVSGQ